MKRIVKPTGSRVGAPPRPRGKLTRPKAAPPPKSKAKTARARQAADFFVHPTAVVDAGAFIGAGTKIWHFCHVQAGARIGRGCTLGQNVYVAATAVIGDGVKIQ